ncbi:hypothetical protein RhiirA4_465551 [Rhizophagus irregularis]|uniref:SAM domain-containing protein n=1 Tax=Rhizophagus irregularis TaxID=588596 RepID=A0A2I1GSD6_9GLOM|nr:hypothetical protein RhiirA4_465551 [Rhizophagus irregularis]
MSTFEENLDDIYKYDTESLIEFLRNNIQIKEEYFDILRDQEITGSIFFKITEETFRSYGLKGGPAKILIEFAKDCMEKKKRPFSSYKTFTDLSSVLSKFNIYGSSLSAVPQFTPSSLSLTNDDDELQQCNLRNLGTLIPDSNEAMRNEYISAILHAAIHIARRETDKEISLLSQLQIVGFIQNVIQCESALQTNRKKRKAGVAFGIANTFMVSLQQQQQQIEEESDLKKKVKQVLEIIAGLLKDRLENEKSTIKKQKNK